MKKQGFFTAMPLVMAVLVFVVCASTFSCEHKGNPSSLTLDDYGRISVRFLTPGAFPARTVLPSMVFDHYVYTFTKAGETSGVELTPDSGGIFTLEVGNYTVTVRAFINNEGQYTLAASGVSAEFSVGTGYNEPVAVYLFGANTAELGEFSYIITYPDGACADITLWAYPDMGLISLSPDPVDGWNGQSETLDLAAGAYLLIVQVSMDDRCAGISEAVHIYPSLTTVYDKDFVDDDFTTAPPPEGPVPPTQPITEGPITADRFEYYWIDQHDSMITTNGGSTVIAVNETLAITAQGNGYSNHQWYLNGKLLEGTTDIDQSGNTYYFSSAAAGNYTISLFIEKNSKLYNTNISITVETDPVTPPPPPPPPPSNTRSVTIDMFDRYSDGWAGNAALTIKVNGIETAGNIKVHANASNNTPSGQKYSNTYAFNAETGDFVELYWVNGSSQNENSFIVYYTDTPPVPAFNINNTANWSGANALIYKLEQTMTNINSGVLLGSFTVN